MTSRGVACRSSLDESEGETPPMRERDERERGETRRRIIESSE